MKTSKLFKDFFESEKSAGLVLIGCTILSLTLANSSFSTNYLDFFHMQIAGHSATHWINDGLMTIFFLLIGLELEREIYKGELSNLKVLYCQLLEHLEECLFLQGFFYFLISALQPNLGQEFQWQQILLLLSGYYLY